MPLTRQQAKRAGEIAAQIEKLEALIAMADTAIAEGWRITTMKVTAPAEGASHPAGTVLDLLPLYPASVANSQMGIAQAKLTYQGEIEALQAQLDDVENWGEDPVPEPEPEPEPEPDPQPEG